MNNHPLRPIETGLNDLFRPKRSHTFWGFWLVLGIAFALMYVKHHVWMQHPNDFFVGAGPDGFKNTLSGAYHLRYDSSYLHFSGMNYPYGDHVLFTDMQPILVNTLMWWSKHVQNLNGTVLFWMNVFRAIAFLLGSGILFLLFRKLHVPIWYAAIVSLGITFLSPQYHHVLDSGSLAHTWVIPLLLLQLSNYEMYYSRRYQSLLIGITVWFAGQIHFYYLGISALFLGLYLLWHMVADSSWRNIRLRFYHYLIMVVLPFTLLNLWVHWSNYASDRSAYPNGFTFYIAKWYGTFLPYEKSEFFRFIKKHVYAFPDLEPEALTNIGWVATIFTLFLLFIRFKMFHPKWTEAAYHRVHQHFLYGSFFAASILLLIAHGLPFSIPGLNWLVEYVGPLRQLRSLGRFTWPYYYVANVLAFYILWNYTQRFKQYGNLPQPVRRGLLVGAILTLSFEAFDLMRIKHINLEPNYTKLENVAKTDNHWLKKIDFSQFQALMPVPYYHIGSENYIFDIYYWSFSDMFLTAYHTGVPDMGVFMSRTSLSQASKSIQLALECCEPPAILDDFPDNRPIAVMVEPTETEKIKNYPHLIEKASLVYNSPEMRIFSIFPDSIKAYQRQFAQLVYRDMQKKANFPTQYAWNATKPNAKYFYQSFDSLETSKFVFQGKGAYVGPLSDSLSLCNLTLPSGDYSFSMWVKTGEDLNVCPEVEVLLKDPKAERMPKQETYAPHQHMKAIVKGWLLLEYILHLDGPETNIQVVVKPQNARGKFYLDEFLLKPADFYLYQKTPDFVSCNNHWYKL
ncbi:MAG: hypothetical protein KGS48_17225 [Bacteroidetes bacterium]|nr:hypothetical protein [Bacteroidota bacterium]